MKLTEITPEELRCAVGACPAIYRSDGGTIVIVGKRLSSEEKFSFLKGKISPDEDAVELKNEFFPNLTSA